MIWANGFPYLDSKGDHVFNVPVSHAMTANALTLPASDFPVREAEHLLSDNKFQGFPIVADRTSKILTGYIGRTELRYAIDRARNQGMVAPNARCIFTREAADASVAQRASVSHLTPDTFDAIETSNGARSIDFSRYVEHTPLTVHPRLPLETVMEIFKKMGPRVILVEHRGRLTGLVTVKDCLKYQFKAEAEEQAVAASEVPLGRPLNRSTDSLEERAWNLLQRLGKKVPWLFPGQGSVRLTGTENQETRILDGTEDSNVELEER